MTTFSSDVADEEQLLFTEADNENEWEETLERKEHSWQNAEQWPANEEPPSSKISAKEFKKIGGNTTSYSMKGIKTNAQIRVEVDRALKNLKLKILGQPHDEVFLTTDPRYKHYEAKEDRIILKDGLLLKKCFGETGRVKDHLTLIPKELVNEVLRSLHREFGKHSGLTKAIIVSGKKYINQKWRNWSRSWS